MLYKTSLWKQSGHWENYKNDMFAVGPTSQEPDKVNESLTMNNPSQKQIAGSLAEQDTEDYALKPMNCPGHCILYASRRRSHRELPIRYTEFSSLHRNENSGSLTGLTRVRRFHQDDGHIFCRLDQIGSEVSAQLKFISEVYQKFGLAPHKFHLSLQPEQSQDGYIGTTGEWETAKSHLTKALQEAKIDFQINPGEAAFYGPKVDVVIRDGSGKDHQTATIQLDFQLPKKFELIYGEARSTKPATDTHPHLEVSRLDDAETYRPVMIHRAIFGSVERFMAMLLEHYQEGSKPRWPFWLNPNQVIILTVTSDPEVVEYAENVAKTLRNASSAKRQPTYRVDLDSSAETINKKIVRVKKMEGIRYNVICIIGKKNVRSGTIDLDLSAQPNLQDSWKCIEDVHQESLTTGQKNQEESGTTLNTTLETARMVPKDFLTVMKLWDERYL